MAETDVSSTTTSTGASTSTTATVDLTGVVNLNTPFIQVTGGTKYKLNVETTASQVKLADGTDAQTRLTTLERAISGKATTRIVNDITERDALITSGAGLIAGDQVWVIDASADSTVESGGAKYLYMLDNSWLKISEAESMDIVFNWALLQDKPTSTVADIDLAVAKQHVHSNKEILDDLSDDGAGNLLYNGARISDGKAWVVSVGSIEDVPANLADGGLVIINAALAVGPQATAYSPANGATDVATTSAVVITFDKDISVGAGNITISDGTTESTVAITDSQISISGKNLIYTPSTAFAVSTTYTFGLPAGLVKDVDNRDSVQVTGYNFTTAAA